MIPLGATSGVLLAGLTAALCAGPAHADAVAEEDRAIRDRRLASRSDSVYTSITSVDGDRLETRDARISLGVPVVRGDGYGAGLFGRYTATWIDSARYLADALTLHRFDLNLGGGGRIAPGWSLRGGLSVTFASDLHGQGPATDALQLSGAVLVRHAINDRSAWTAGLAYSSTSALPVIPMLGYVYQRAGSRFRFDGTLPHRLRATYRVAPRLDTSLGVEARGDQWQVSGGPRALRVERDGGAVFGEVGIAAFGPLRLELRLGASFDRLTLPDAMSETANATTIDVPLQASAYGQLQLVVVPP